jgi:hypothetical protein
MTGHDATILFCLASEYKIEGWNSIKSKFNALNIKKGER